VTAPGVVAIVQARMSSRRFPGKVLVPFKGRAILDHVLTVVESVVGVPRVIVATSVEPSDDPIATFANARDTRVVRGDLANVLARYRDAAQTVDAEWILRVSADSPMLDPDVLRRVIAAADDGSDVVTTTRPRTFPRGRNAELIRRSALMSADAARASADEQEHVTPYFYNRPATFRIRNVESGHPEWAAASLAVDTPEDLAYLEGLTAAELNRFSLAHS
jgi:spore coat polysaccharide biosynthesis protein SpsF